MAEKIEYEGKPGTVAELGNGAPEVFGTEGLAGYTAGQKPGRPTEYMVPVGLTRGRPGEVPAKTVYRGGTTG